MLHDAAVYSVSGWEPRRPQYTHQISCRSCLMSQNHRYIWTTNDPNEIKSINIPHHCWIYKNNPPLLLLLEGTKPHFIITYMRGTHWPVPWKLQALCKSRAAQNTVDRCPLVPSLLNILRWPANLSWSWRCYMDITWWKGIPSLVLKAFKLWSMKSGHTRWNQPATLFCTPRSDLGLRWGAGTWQVKNIRCSMASPPSELLLHCFWPRKVTPNFMKGFPNVKKTKNPQAHLQRHKSLRK